MKYTDDYNAATASLLARAKQSMLDDMKARGIGIILWDNSMAGFHFIPEIVHHSAEKDKTRVARIEGLYAYKGELYLIEEDRAPVNINDFYNRNTEVKPTIVTLSEENAVAQLGDPNAEKGFTQQGSTEEWLTIADCYFEALAEE